MTQDNISIKTIAETVKRLTTGHTETKPIIVAYGLMNAGKSFLLNMLTQHIEEEFFKTNDIRETAEVKEFESDEYIYLDTPGLDANTTDDLRAKLGASRADVVLFVHQPQGELEAIEFEFLKEIKQSFGTYADSNIILVLSKIEKEEPGKIKAIEQKIKSQCSQELGFSPKVFKVSNKRYQAGVIKNKDNLIAESHIKALAHNISCIASNAQKVRTERNLVESEAMLQALNAREQSLKDKKAKINEILNEKFSIFDNQINCLKQFLEDSLSQYQRI